MDCGDVGLFPGTASQSSGSTRSTEVFTWWELQYDSIHYPIMPAMHHHRFASKELAMEAFNKAYEESGLLAEMYKNIRVVKVTRTTEVIETLPRKPYVEHPDYKKFLLAQE